MGPVLGPVTFKYYVPGKPLGEFVRLFWYWRGHDAPSSRERVLPTGTFDLIINLGSSRTSGGGIAGPRSQSVVIELGAPDELLGIHFESGGAFPFLPLPSGELHNLDVTLADLWGEPRAGELMSLLDEASTIDMKFQILETWLMLAAHRPLQHHPAVSYAVKEFQRHPGLASAAMADRVGFSQRRFIQVFRDVVGLTPKLFCRVQRFQQAINKTRNHTSVDWVDIALSCGFYDQAHFIHDFQQLSGMTPTQYLALRTDELNHVKVHE